MLTEEETTYARNPLTHVDFLLFRRMDKSPLLAVEVDGAAFHAAGSVQANRDEKKNRIFEQCGIPLLRLRTDGSGEEERIEQALRSAVYNMGQNGREIPSAAPAFPADTDLLIIMLGINDLLQGRSPEKSAERLEQFLSDISLDPSKVLLIAPPPVTLGAWVPSAKLIDDSRTFARLCQTLVERTGIRFADAGKWDIPLAYDGVHFTEQGHKAFAAGLLEELK